VDFDYPKMSKSTKELLKLVEKRAGEHNSASEAYKLIQQGADIKTQNKDGQYMIQLAVGYEQRSRHAQSYQADNCKRLIQVLQNRASELLSTTAAANGDVNEMRLLV
ncbi:unnamed protein product, partial [Didymodactylos carnosus]